jgi:hypothetical protein
VWGTGTPKEGRVDENHKSGSENKERGLSRGWKFVYYESINEIV